MTQTWCRKALANQPACANQVRYNWAHASKRKRDASLPSTMQYWLHLGTELGEGAEPSVEMVNGGEELSCSFYCPKQLHISQANNLVWNLVKQVKLDQGVDKLTTAYSGCLQMQVSKLLSLLTKEASAPEEAYAIQLIRRNGESTNVESISKCSRRCPCKRSSAPNCAIVPKMTSVRRPSQS